MRACERWMASNRGSAVRPRSPSRPASDVLAQVAGHEECPRPPVPRRSSSLYDLLIRQSLAVSSQSGQRMPSQIVQFTTGRAAGRRLRSRSRRGPYPRESCCWRGQLTPPERARDRKWRRESSASDRLVASSRWFGAFGGGRVRTIVALRHADLGRPQQPVVMEVARLQHLRHGARGTRGIHRLEDRLVAVGVEPLPERIDPTDAVPSRRPRAVHVRSPRCRPAVAVRFRPPLSRSARSRSRGADCLRSRAGPGPGPRQRT